jgi:hypothetical protein
MDEEFIEVIPTEDLGVEEMLEDIKDMDLDYAVVLGQMKDGSYYFAASNPDALRAMYLSDQFKNYVLGNM